MQSLKAFEKLVMEFKRLPGIGEKSARRIVFHLLKASDKNVERLADALINLKKEIVTCKRCFNLSDQTLCAICRDPDRKPVLCVVQDVGDLMAIERTGEFRGRYHVLGGVISPLDGIGPDQLKIKELLERIPSESISEVIIATNLTVEGEATAMYIARLLKSIGVKVFRIAHGLPVGASLEYADEATTVKALEGRKEL